MEILGTITAVVIDGMTIIVDLEEIASIEAIVGTITAVDTVIPATVIHRFATFQSRETGRTPR